MDPDILTPEPDTVEATTVTTMNDEIVHLSVGGRVDGQVKGGRVNQSYVMNAKVIDLCEAQNPRASVDQF